ncbi:MAG: O-antigen ligase family protein [Acidobacteria bacterium]|nr:O-antigen ligase family protein [Acidobacteriota bacterium]
MRFPLARGRADAWDPLLACVAAYILTAVGRIHQLFAPLAAFHPAMLAGALAILLYALDARSRRRLVHSWAAPASRFTAALLGWMLLSTPFALVIGNSFDLVVHNFVKTVAMVFVIAGCVRTTRDVERLAYAYFAAAAIYAVVVVSRFSVGGADWRLDNLYYYDANDFATFIVTAVPFGLYFLHAGQPFGRGLPALGLVVLMVAFVQTGSRGGFIAMSAVVIYVVARYTTIPARYRLGGALLLVVVVLAVATNRYWSQMTTILADTDYNRTSETGRLQIWSRGVGYMLRFPVLGVGPANFETAEGTLSDYARRAQYGMGVSWNAAHNSYIQAGAELGFPGLALFAGILGSSLWSLRRLERRRCEPHGDALAQRKLSQAMAAALIGFACGAFFLSLAYHEMMYTLVGLAVGLVKLAPAAAGARR